MKFVFDEHIDRRIARGLQRLQVVDIVLAGQELTGMSDSDLIEWSTQQQRLLVTANVNTLIGFAYERIKAGVHTEGIFVLRHTASIADVVKALELILIGSDTSEWANLIVFIPL